MWREMRRAGAGTVVLAGTLLLLWCGLRYMAQRLWEQKPFRRFTNWNLISLALCLVEVALRRGRSLLAAFAITNSVAICASFYSGILRLDGAIFVQWAEEELIDYKSWGPRPAPPADYALQPNPESLFLPFVELWNNVVPELQNGLNLPVEYAVAFHAGSALLHVIPALLAWRYLRPCIAATAPWWVLGSLSAAFHMSWAWSVNGSFMLNDIYFGAPDDVWYTCWVFGNFTHMYVAYLLQEDLERARGRTVDAAARLPKADPSSVGAPDQDTPTFDGRRKRMPKQTAPGGEGDLADIGSGPSRPSRRAARSSRRRRPYV